MLSEEKQVEGCYVRHINQSRLRLRSGLQKGALARLHQSRARWLLSGLSTHSCFLYYRWSRWLFTGGQTALRLLPTVCPQVILHLIRSTRLTLVYTNLIGDLFDLKMASLFILILSNELNLTSDSWCALDCGLKGQFNQMTKDTFPLPSDGVSPVRVLVWFVQKEIHLCLHHIN